MGPLYLLDGASLPFTSSHSFMFKVLQISQPNRQLADWLASVRAGNGGSELRGISLASLVSWFVSSAYQAVWWQESLRGNYGNTPDTSAPDAGGSKMSHKYSTQSLSRERERELKLAEVDGQAGSVFIRLCD